MARLFWNCSCPPTTSGSTRRSQSTSRSSQSTYSPFLFHDQSSSSLPSNLSYSLISFSISLCHRSPSHFLRFELQIPPTMFLNLTAIVSFLSNLYPISSVMQFSLPIPLFFLPTAAFSALPLLLFRNFLSFVG